MQVYRSDMPLLAATNFVADTGGMSQIVLTCLWFGLVFCVLVAMVRVVLGGNKILGGVLILIVVTVTWISYENATEFSTYSALGLAFNLIPVKTSAFSGESLNQLFGGQW